MAKEQFLNPVGGDEVPKIDNAVAVGEDLEFQERWWKFEKIIWSFFLLIVVADMLGVFGRGWLAKARLGGEGTGMVVDYERVERASTPSIMDIKFQPDAVVNNAVQLFVSDTIVKQLGNMRVSPQPRESVIGDGGITYTFPVHGAGARVQLALEPSFPGAHPFTLQVPGKVAVGGHIVVVP